MFLLNIVTKAKLDKLKIKLKKIKKLKFAGGILGNHLSNPRGP
jgi:hypothetical protein